MSEKGKKGSSKDRTFRKIYSKNSGRRGTITGRVKEKEAKGKTRRGTSTWRAEKVAGIRSVGYCQVLKRKASMFSEHG